MPRSARIAGARFALLVATTSSALGHASTAQAGGFFLFERGNVAVSRGGAFVAGADDADALWFNPAGLLGAGRQLQMDVALPRISATYRRVDAFDDPLPEVSASQAFLPTPTLAYTDDFGLRRWAFGVGMFTPSAVVLEWPTAIEGGTEPAPQRYSLLSLRGTILASMAAGAAYDAGHGLSFGVSLGAHVADFDIDTVVSGCDGLICTNSEDPSFDSRVGLHSGMRFAPLATFGARYEHDAFTVGASFSTPYRFRGDMDLDAQLPSSPVFNFATIETADGRRPRVSSDLRFPWTLRLGVETRPLDDLRVEVAYVAEGWKVQDELRFTPDDVSIHLLGDVVVFDLIPIVVPRRMRTTHSIRAGTQYTAGRFDVRGGLAFETGAFPDETLSPLTLDSNKTTLSAGGSARVGGNISVDVALAYAFMRDRNVTNSVVLQPTAVEPLAGEPEQVANGRYEMGAFYVGAGLRWQPPARER